MEEREVIKNIEEIVQKLLSDVSVAYPTKANLQYIQGKLIDISTLIDDYKQKEDGLLHF